MPIEASTNSFKTPIFKGYSGCVLFGIIVASRAKVAPFALCLLDGMAPKPLSPAQTLWLFCESAGFVIVMDGVFIEVVIFWCGVLVTIWCTVSFQYIVVVPDVLEVSQLRLQLVERCLIVFFPLLQLIVLRRQFFQRRYLSIER